MKALAVIFGIYAGVGLLTCIALAFRKSKSPHATKAIHLFAWDPNPANFALSILLWPLWAFIQIAEQDTLKPPREPETNNKPENPDSLVGQVGTTITAMVPSGKIRIGEKDYEAISSDGKLDRNEIIEVYATSMGMLKVKRQQQNPPHPALHTNLPLTTLNLPKSSNDQ